MPVLNLVEMPSLPENSSEESSQKNTSTPGEKRVLNQEEFDKYTVVPCIVFPETSFTLVLKWGKLFEEGNHFFHSRNSYPFLHFPSIFLIAVTFF